MYKSLVIIQVSLLGERMKVAVRSWTQVQILRSRMNRMRVHRRRILLLHRSGKGYNNSCRVAYLFAKGIKNLVLLGLWRNKVLILVADFMSVHGLRYIHKYLTAQSMDCTDIICMWWNSTGTMMIAEFLFLFLQGPASNPEANCNYFKWAASKSRGKWTY